MERPAGTQDDVFKCIHHLEGASGLSANDLASHINTAFLAPVGLNHTAAMLIPEGLKAFVLPHRNSFPYTSNRGSGNEIYRLWPIWLPCE